MATLSCGNMERCKVSLTTVCLRYACVQRIRCVYLLWTLYDNKICCLLFEEAVCFYIYIWIFYIL